MDKQTFCSSQTTSNTSRYAAALYRRGTRAWAPLQGSWGGDGSRMGGPPGLVCSPSLECQTPVGPGP